MRLKDSFPSFWNGPVQAPPFVPNESRSRSRRAEPPREWAGTRDCGVSGVVSRSQNCVYRPRCRLLEQSEQAMLRLPLPDWLRVALSSF